MFIRIKTIKNQQYAYKVENSWKKRKKSSRQVVKGYLGKVYVLQPAKELSFEEFIKTDLNQYIKKISSKEMVRDIIGYELSKYGFKKTRQSWNLDNITVNLSELKVTKDGNKAVLRFDNDFLCDFTLRNLLNFKSSADAETVAKELATSFIQAGIPVRQDLFVEVFNKVHKRDLSMIQ